jgi:hypothetical protein
MTGCMLMLCTWLKAVACCCLLSAGRKGWLERNDDALQARCMEEELLSVASAFSTALHMAVGAFSDAVEAEQLPYDTATAALEKVRLPRLHYTNSPRACCSCDARETLQMLRLVVAGCCDSQCQAAGRAARSDVCRHADQPGSEDVGPLTRTFCTDADITTAICDAMGQESIVCDTMSGNAFGVYKQFSLSVCCSCIGHFNLKVWSCSGHGCTVYTLCGSLSLEGRATMTYVVPKCHRCMLSIVSPAALTIASMSLFHVHAHLLLCLSASLSRMLFSQSYRALPCSNSSSLPPALQRLLASCRSPMSQGWRRVFGNGAATDSR